MANMPREAFLQARMNAKLYGAGNVAILTRSNRLADEVGACFEGAKMEYNRVTRSGFWSSDTAIGIMHGLMFLLNPADSLLCSRAINWPKKRMSRPELNAIRQAMVDNRLTMIQALMQMEIEDYSEFGSNVIDFISESQESTTLTIDSEDAEIFIIRAIKYLWLKPFDSGMKDQNGNPNDGYMADSIYCSLLFQPIREKVSQLRDAGLPTIGDFIEWYIARDQQEEIEEERDRITVSTVHMAKGLEWDLVILPGWNSGLPVKHGDLEEERRVGYVAITRAKQEVIFIHDGQRSEFITGTEEANVNSHGRTETETETSETEFYR
jgi:DNA helicase-2/ATP-dependent DNA helicase PcrA